MTSRNGPGDARPTALQIVKDEGVSDALRGKIIFITGTTSGIGIETARALYSTGAHIFCGVRDTEKGEEVARDIAGDEVHERIHVIKLDLNSLDSVRKAVQTFLGKSQKLNILINNAGVAATPEGMRTEEGFDAQFGINHLGHHLLFQLLKPALLKGSTPSFNSRVVSLSSLGHRFAPIQFEDLNFEKSAFDTWKAYGQAKTANILLANEIERRYGSQGLHATSINPGGIKTRILRYTDKPPASNTMSESDRKLGPKLMKSAEQGAATTVWAAIGKEWEGKGGKYLEDCAISQPCENEASALAPGHSPRIYDAEAAKKLWDISDMLVGFNSE